MSARRAKMDKAHRSDQIKQMNLERLQLVVLVTRHYWTTASTLARVATRHWQSERESARRRAHSSEASSNNAATCAAAPVVESVVDVQPAALGDSMGGFDPCPR